MPKGSRQLWVAFVLGWATTAASQDPAPLVSVMPVPVQDVSPSSEFIGRVEAVNAVDIRARVAGFIEARPFTEGQAVQEGQELFLIEKASYEAALSAAQATLAGAQARLAEAEGRLQRNRELRRSQTVSQAVLDEIQAARDVAQADVHTAQAGVRQAGLNLEYTTIKAPIAGSTGIAAFSVGSFVDPSSGPLARVVQVDPVRVVFSVSDRTILDLRAAAGDAAKSEVARTYVPGLRLSNGREYPSKGKIEVIGNELDPRTGTLPIRGRFPNPDAVLVPGQFVTVVVRPSDPRRRPVVPVGAVQLDREGRFVLIVQPDGKAAVRRIRTSTQLGQNWVVEDGLEGGEDLIVQGLQNVRPGLAVRVVEGRTETMQGVAAEAVSR